MKLLSKTLRIALVAFVAGVASAAGNVVGMRYVAPLVESRLPSRTSERDEPQDVNPARTPGSALRYSP